MIIITSLLTIIFLCLAILHLHWALGGTWGLANTLPMKSDVQLAFTPPATLTLLVALALLSFAFFYFINPEKGNPRNWIFDYGRCIVPILFGLRVVGDFKYVGLFKKINNTPFAKMDNKVYLPVSALIATLGLIVKLFG